MTKLITGKKYRYVHKPYIGIPDLGIVILGELIDSSYHINNNPFYRCKCQYDGYIDKGRWISSDDLRPLTKLEKVLE